MKRSHDFSSTMKQIAAADAANDPIINDVAQILKIGKLAQIKIADVTGKAMVHKNNTNIQALNIQSKSSDLNFFVKIFPIKAFTLLNTC